MLTLYYHPLASFCHKVLIALYENATEFSPQSVDVMNREASAEFFELWPVGKMPVLRDERTPRTVPESTIIIEYLQQHYPGPVALLPRDPQASLDARLWDRFYDHYVQVPLQKIVVDRLRAENERDPRGVSEARAMLHTAYGMTDRQLGGKTWAIGDSFTMADCSAAPALFYAGIVEPFPAQYSNLHAYFERLLVRPSFKRVLDEARPYFHMFPFKDQMPERFLS